MIKKAQNLYFCVFCLLQLLLAGNCTPVITKIETPPKVTQYTKRTASMIQSEINRHKSDVKRLHRQLLTEGKTLAQGFITFQIVIEPSGLVTDVKVTRNTFGEAFASEMKKLILTWKFDEVEDPNSQIVELPYAFTEQNP